MPKTRPVETRTRDQIRQRKRDIRAGKLSAPPRDEVQAPPSNVTLPVGHAEAERQPPAPAESRAAGAAEAKAEARLAAVQAAEARVDEERARTQATSDRLAAAPHDSARVVEHRQQLQRLADAEQHLGDVRSRARQDAPPTPTPGDDQDDHGDLSEELLDGPPALYGPPLPATFDIGGETVQLGTVVGRAHRESGLSVEEWNALPDDQMTARVEATLTVMRAEASKAE